MQYVQTARSKGLTENRVIWKHAVRNAMHPLIMILGGALPGIISGETVVAIVMNIPTVGPMYFNAQLNQDLYLAATFLMFLSISGCARKPAGGYCPGLGRSAHPLRVMATERGEI